MYEHIFINFFLLKKHRRCTGSQPERVVEVVLGDLAQEEREKRVGAGPDHGDQPRCKGSGVGFLELRV